MKDKIFKALRFFLQKNDLKGPLLLGYSGGPDSKALLHVLLDLRKEVHFFLHIAHIDHGWRKESSQQAETLKQEIENLGLPFHLKKVTFSQENNLEERARKERLLFFSILYQKYECRALLLAHQKDDLNETCLKRVLEGASLPFLYGLCPQSTLMNMNVWRPFLEVSKKEIRCFLAEKNVLAFEDETNFDPKYLRARMRKEIFPHLRKNFGKEFQENLSSIARSSYELKQYLDEKISSILPVKGPWGVYFDLREKPVFELRYFLNKNLKKYKKVCSRDPINRLINWIQEKKGNKKITEEILVHKGFFFILDTKQTVSFSVQISPLEKKEKNSDWRDLFSGAASICLPNADYKIKIPSPNEFYGKTPLRHWYSKNEVPPFLRHSIPVVYRDQKIYAELLSGRNKNNYEGTTEYIKINITFIPSGVQEPVFES